MAFRLYLLTARISWTAWEYAESCWLDTVCSVIIGSIDSLQAGNFEFPASFFKIHLGIVTAIFRYSVNETQQSDVDFIELRAS